MSRRLPRTPRRASRGRRAAGCSRHRSGACRGRFGTSGKGTACALATGLAILTKDFARTPAGHRALLPAVALSRGDPLARLVRVPHLVMSRRSQNDYQVEAPAARPARAQVASAHGSDPRQLAPRLRRADRRRCRPGPHRPHPQRPRSRRVCRGLRQEPARDTVSASPAGRARPRHRRQSHPLQRACRSDRGAGAGPPCRAVAPPRRRPRRRHRRRAPSPEPRRSASATTSSGSASAPTCPSCCASSDIGLNVSHEEGFSNAVIEGMAAGLPMLVTRRRRQCRGGAGWHRRLRRATASRRTRSPQPSCGSLVIRSLRHPDGARGAGAGDGPVQPRHCVDHYLEAYRAVLDGRPMPTDIDPRQTRLAPAATRARVARRSTGRRAGTPMCGITGFIDLKRQTSAESLEAIARRMADSMPHRGPDDSGTWADADSRRRLRLPPPRRSSTCRRPAISRWSSAAGRHVICYNGEVYNAEELRRELGPRRAQLARPLRHRGDARSLRRLGRRARRRKAHRHVRLRALGADTRRLWLVRDRLGIKPLYWARDGLELPVRLGAPGAARASGVRGRDRSRCHGALPSPQLLSQSAHGVLGRAAAAARTYALPRARQAAAHRALLVARRRCAPRPGRSLQGRRDGSVRRSSRRCSPTPSSAAWSPTCRSAPSSRAASIPRPSSR